MKETLRLEPMLMGWAGMPARGSTEEGSCWKRLLLFVLLVAVVVVEVPLMNEDEFHWPVASSRWWWS